MVSSILLVVSSFEVVEGRPKDDETKKALSRDDHSYSWLPFEMRLLLEF